MPLTVAKVENAKPGAKTRRIYDSGGMYLEISPSGGKWWRLKYRHDGKEKRLSLGTFPTTSLADARERRNEARKLISSGVDPSQHRKASRRTGNDGGKDSFEAIAREWHAKKSPVWVASHASRIMLRLENDVFPWLGKRQVRDITAKEFLDMVNRVANRGAKESASRILQNCGQIMRYAIATGRAERNPVADLRGALESVRPKHHAAIVDPGGIGQLLRAIESYRGTFITRCALQLAPLVFLRPGELRHAEWVEFDLDNAEWNIPAEKMKGKTSHLVPLAPQALAILHELKPLTGHCKYVFTGARSVDRPMSENTVTAALRRMGFSSNEMTGHGFRAMARTVLDEILHVRPDFIEHQLAHTVRDPNGRAYNRTAHLSERRLMMAQWANYLDELKARKPSLA